MGPFLGYWLAYSGNKRIERRKIQKNFEQTRIKIDNLQERLREVELKQASQKTGQ